MVSGIQGYIDLKPLTLLAAYYSRELGLEHGEHFNFVHISGESIYQRASAKLKNQTLFTNPSEWCQKYHGHNWQHSKLVLENSISVFFRYRCDRDKEEEGLERRRPSLGEFLWQALVKLAIFHCVFVCRVKEQYLDMYTWNKRLILFNYLIFYVITKKKKGSYECDWFF